MLDQTERRAGRAAGQVVEHFQVRDVLTVPGLLSLVRFPLAIAFSLSFPSPAATTAVLVAAGVSDLLDGWCARRSGRATVTGAVLDPLMDKLFVAVVAITLLVGGRLSLPMVLCLGARDAIEAPLAAWLVFDRRVLADRSGRVRANVAGKLATVAQFAAITAALWKPVYAGPLAAASGVAGVIAAATYWARAIGHRRARGRRGARPEPQNVQNEPAEEQPSVRRRAPV